MNKSSSEARVGVESHHQLRHPAPSPHFLRIDHIALAVKDVNAAVAVFCNHLGFTLTNRLEIRGAKTGMISAELEANGIKFVLCQGTEPSSQVSKLIDNFGVGVAHIALEVHSVSAAFEDLSSRGVAFDTSIISSPGLTQTFTSRYSDVGLSFELIARNGEQGFSRDGVQQLFNQMENGGKF
ncbi:VOC family protein (plasmid) [Burkholderia gladioli]|uniref:VOC family protein n=1 Tax=Burkholderia gladioli TaxID=28095 RepID=UPI001937A185|nr:VOC family protein [Burkholderia gladioli]QPQ89128.1 VOC family protein [Burkholderia gladioli]